MGRRIGELKKEKRLLQRLTTEFPADPGQAQTQVHQDLHTHVHSGHGWKQPKCPLMDEWISKLWYTHTMDEKECTDIYVKMWIDL